MTPQLPQQGGDPSLPQQVTKFYDLKINRKAKKGKIRIAPVPPEEYLINRQATSHENARFQCHRSEKTKSELIALGYTAEQVDESGFNSELEFNSERLARAPYLQNNTFGDDGANEANRTVPYYESYIKVDYDGDGVAELRRICSIGKGKNVVSNEPVDEGPFHVISPDPEPHVAFGNSIADLVMDIQRIKSQILRLTLDSLSQSVTPRTAVVQGQVVMDDLLNPQTSGIVRMNQPGMVQDLTQPFVGQAAFPVLTYLDETRKDRTGVSNNSQGLSADVLQSTTKTAVSAAVQAEQERIELVARIIAETGVKSLFKRLLRLAVAHQDRAEIVRLRGKFVQINPGEWDASMDVSVNVGLGGGTKEEKLNVFGQIAQKQENILLQLGPSNPLVSMGQYSKTLRKMAELAGIKDASSYFNDVPPNYQPPQPAQPQITPEQQAALMLAQAEQRKIDSGIQHNSFELQLKQRQTEMHDATERYRIDAQTKTALNEQSLKYGANVAQVNAQIESDENKHLSQLMLDQQQHQQSLDASAQQADQDRQHQAELAKQQQAADAQQAASQPQGQQ